MKQPLKKRLTAAVTGVLVALSTATLAMGPHGPDHDPARMLSHMSERL